MFLSLLAAEFIISLMVCVIIAKFFMQPINAILEKIVTTNIAHAWSKYMKFAIYVVGISGGTSFYRLADSLRAPSKNFTPPELTLNRWVLEIYSTIMNALEAIAFMLLFFRKCRYLGRYFAHPSCKIASQNATTIKLRPPSSHGVTCLNSAHFTPCSQLALRPV